AQPARGNLFLGLLDAGRSKFGTGGQIHGPHEPAKLDGGKAVLLREVENLEPVPGRAAERRKADRQAFAGSAQVGWQRRQSRSEEHTSELQSRFDLVCRLLLEKKKK